MTLALFEDERYRNFLPLAYTRPVFELKTGLFSLREKCERVYGLTPALFCRSYLTEKVRTSYPHRLVNESLSNPTLFLNGRVLAHPELSKRIALEGPETLFTSSREIVGFRVRDPKKLSFTNEGLLDPETVRRFPKSEIDVQLIAYPWELIHENPNEIENDLRLISERGEKESQPHPSAVLVNEEAITISENVSIGPFAVLDASEGPIVIGSGARLLPHATIVGPAYIGSSSLVKIGAKIYGGTSVGPTCKIGGEIEGSIIHGFSNKQHEGFLGHAYIGEWCNLGAGSENSDLKNTYGTVNVIINGQQVDSGQPFVGLFLADHVKSGINTMFNTGTIVGVSSNVFGPGYPPKAIPSFAWYDTTRGLQTYDLEKAIAVAEKVMGRRKFPMTEPDRNLLRAVFKLTESEREAAAS